MIHLIDLAPVVQKMGNFLSTGEIAIQRINCTPGVISAVQSVDSAMHSLSMIC